MSVPLTIVTYHYVRSRRDPRFPDVKALNASTFREQLDYIERNYDPVGVPEVIAALGGDAQMPSRPILLTFDDGYLDHYTEVFPLLFERQIPGAFFAPLVAAAGRHVLETNKIQYVLAAGANPGELIAWIEQCIGEARREGASGVESIDRYRACFQAALPSDLGLRFDSPEVLYVKRLLQHLLPEVLRSEIVDQLFRRHVSSDEADFAAGLYATIEQLSVMRSCGMYIGPHGASHRWLNYLSRDEQADDIDRSLEILNLVGGSRSEYAFCYPYGGYNADTLALLEQRGCAFALSTRLGIADLGKDPALQLPRIDCRDIATAGTVPPLF
jgi:peptidoglycan/xylan/chitin deacetylase (PgdA/CDA1 family)